MGAWKQTYAAPVLVQLEGKYTGCKCVLYQSNVYPTGQDLESSSARVEEGTPAETPAESEPSKSSPESLTREADGKRVETASADSSLAKRGANEEKELADVRTDGLLCVTGGPSIEEQKNFAG
jgi:hypothetical protein